MYSKGNQLALIVEANVEDDNRTIRIVTTHLKASKDESGEAVRLHQATELVDHLQRLDRRPTLLAADLNATPTATEGSLYDSTVYPYVAQTYRSSYARVLSRELPYSTWKSRHGRGVVKHTIDYIWYSPPDWRVEAVLDTPSEIDASLLPSYRYGSDHLALVADLSLVERSS